MDITILHSLLANTTPTVFWTLYHIFCDPALLEEVGAALMAFVTTNVEKSSISYNVDISCIRDLPILGSISCEALRHYGLGSGMRMVVEDHNLDDQYLLKKGSLVFIPNRCYHFDAQF
jgi:cytochrome P450